MSCHALHSEGCSQSMENTTHMRAQGVLLLEHPLGHTGIWRRGCKMGRTCSGQALDGLGKTMELSLLLNASHIQVVALVLLLSTEGV